MMLKFHPCEVMESMHPLQVKQVRRGYDVLDWNSLPRVPQVLWIDSDNKILFAHDFHGYV